MANTILAHLLCLAKQNYHWKEKTEAYSFEIEKCIVFSKKGKRKRPSTLLRLLQNVSIADQIAFDQSIQMILPYIATKKNTFLLYNIHVKNGHLHLIIASYGFSNNRKNRTTSYEADELKWMQAVELSNKNHYELLKQDFNKHFESAKRLLKLFDILFYAKDYQQASLLMYQIIEQLYLCILRVFGGNQSNTSSRTALRKQADRFNKELAKIFPLAKSVEIKQLDWLCQTYYLYLTHECNKSHALTRQTLIEMDKKVQRLSQLIKNICQKKIKSLSSHR